MDITDKPYQNNDSKQGIVTKGRRDSMMYTLKMLRASKNWSQVTVAQQIGVSVDTWGNWERKRSFPDVLHIQRIQEVFNVAYDDIIFL